MLRLHTVGMAVLALALFANVASAQSNGSDSLWNGAVIGAGVGIGSTAALDAVFCDNGFGGCDTPWKGYLVLGGIGAGAGAGIDYLIGRNANPRRTGVRVTPILGPGRQGLRASLLLPQRGSLPPPVQARQRGTGEGRDSVWNGTLIGAGIGAGSGYIWARSQCPHDTECFAIAGTVGIIGGAAIGAAAGAIADALHD